MVGDRTTGAVSPPLSDNLPGRLVILGHPIAHSLSPVFQNAALEAAGHTVRYEALDVPADLLSSVVEQLRLQHAAGNVTVPHKEAMVALCARVSPLARRVGAVNTFCTAADGQLEGHNTDVLGFGAMADALGVRRDGARVACLGAGGAAAALCAAVESWPGSTVRLHARDAARAAALAQRFGPQVSAHSSRSEAVHDCTLVVNATPIGLTGSALPVSVDEIPRDADVMDLVYRVGETAWVHQARQRGHRAADGREMLLQQGAAAFTVWFGHPPDVHIMRAALEAAARG